MFKIISITLFIIISLIYNLYIIIKYKTIPVSLSETSYILGGLKRYGFTVYCTSSVFLILPCLLVTLPENLMFLAFLMCSGMLFAGMSPIFKEGLDKKVHYIASIFSFVIFLIFTILVMGGIYLLIYLLMLGILTLFKKDCYVYFAEILIFIYILIGLIV